MALSSLISILLAASVFTSGWSSGSLSVSCSLLGSVSVPPAGSEAPMIGHTGPRRVNPMACSPVIGCTGRVVFSDMWLSPISGSPRPFRPRGSMGRVAPGYRWT
ncbi:Uncharacterised protein [Mycobacteroides abscessus subsp. abscessus]|nr:Uncharacterised protein [Mycobacteroides abscessus subsp. abscessus]